MLTGRRGRVVAILSAAVVVAAVAVVLAVEPDRAETATGPTAYDAPWPTLHNDPDPPLMVGIRGTVPTGDSWSGTISWWTDTEPQTTFGAAVCRREDVTVTITDVAPLQSIGDGYRVLGTLVQPVPAGQPHTGSDGGFPPDTGGTFQQVGDATVGAVCGQDAHGGTDVLVGLEGTGPEGVGGVASS